MNQAESLSIRPVRPEDVDALSVLATAIVREHFDPLIGPEQNSYMLERFQSPTAIRQQIADGFMYYLVQAGGNDVGFLAFFPRSGKLYLSKFYLERQARGRHLAKKMLNFVIDAARQAGLPAIFLNVNRNNADVIAIYQHLGFRIIREEKNDIGSGFYMDDFVMEYTLTGPKG